MRSMRPWLPPCLIGFLSAAACGGTGDAPADDELDIIWDDAIALEESTDVVNVFPVVRFDAADILVADNAEARFRIYSADGRLEASFGRPGSGPGEFRAPTGLVRLGDRRLFAIDQTGRAAIFAPGGSVLIRALALPLSNVTDVHVLTDGRLLLSGFPADRGPDGDWLHILDLATDSIVHSFFRPFATARAKVAAASVGWVHASVRGDSVAAIFSPLDTVYVMTLDGATIYRTPIRGSDLRPVLDPPASARTDPVARGAWAETFDLVTAVHWMNDGRFVVPFQSFEHNLPARHLLVLSRAGHVEFTRRNMPRLLAVNPDGRLLFQHPDSDTPNVLRFARYRSRGRARAARSTYVRRGIRCHSF